MRQLGLPGLTLADATRFGAFWPGPNAAALAAAKRTAARADEPVVYLYGPAASGKTHLLKAAWRQAHEAGRQAAYLPLGEALMLDPELIEGWGALEFTALDGVERVAGYTAWERALFRLVEELREHGGTLLAAGRYPPDRIGLELPDLASRLAWGPVYSLAPLDDAELAELAAHLAQTRGLALSAPVARYLIRRLARDPAALAAAMARLDEAALAAQRRLTIPFVSSVLFADES